MSFEHKSVLLEETAGLLSAAGKKGVFVDATLGFGGHSERILKDMSPEAVLIGIDQDPEALAIATERLKAFPNFRAVQGNFRDLEKILAASGITEISGIMYDLGVSSLQFDKAERGFSFNKEAPLDMRMDPTSELTAWDVVNRYDRADLERVIMDYGEEGHYKKIADYLMKSRPVNTTIKLAEIIAKAKNGGGGRINPATQVFQAIRIEVNGELEAVTKSLSDAVKVTVPGGRICVISFHSLEDRIVKNFFRDRAKGCDCSYNPCRCGKVRTLELITKKVVTAQWEEVKSNPRSRSAKLRVAQKL
jgi:16S rRNA (cytosine1402-N4)-methyltransferase